MWAGVPREGTRCTGVGPARGHKQGTEEAETDKLGGETKRDKRDRGRYATRNQVSGKGRVWDEKHFLAPPSPPPPHT